MIVCREDTVKIVVDQASDWEYIYPSEVEKRHGDWVKKVKEFHNDYFSHSDFDTPLGYILFYDEDGKVVRIIALSLFANEFDPSTPEIIVVDVDEWLSNDP